MAFGIFLLVYLREDKLNQVEFSKIIYPKHIIHIQSRNEVSRLQSSGTYTRSGFISEFLSMIFKKNNESLTFCHEVANSNLCNRVIEAFLGTRCVNFHLRPWADVALTHRVPTKYSSPSCVQHSSPKRGIKILIS